MKRDTLDKIINRLEHLETDELRHLFIRLASEKGVLQDVFDALRDGLILFDADGKASFANKAACNLFNCPMHELLHMPFERLVGGTCRWDELSRSGVAITRDLHVNYPESRHYNFLMSPVAQGREYLLLIRDDTEHVVRDREDAEAEQFNLVTYMAGAVAHEIGNPLNSLGLNLQLLQRKLSKADVSVRRSLSPLLETALEETRRLDTLLRQFLQSMRPGHMQRGPVHLNEVLDRVLQVLEPEMAPRGIAVSVSLAKDLPELCADGGQLFQAFYNLIRNAFQSIPVEESGGIFIQSDFNDNDVRVIIGDNGSGISHEVMGNMYEPFRTTKRKGTGLGLLIVRHIIKEHGGTLSLASKEGTGTTVTITLPRADRVVRLLPS